jgi:hypothetical protein
VSSTYSGVTKTASLTVGSSSTTTSTTYSIWPSATPSTITEVDPNPVELGLKFKASVNGHVTGVRFYKGPYNVGTHVAHLWTASGTMLASATFTNETYSGWQKVYFSTPVAITAGTEYVVSYYAPKGEYSANGGYFSSAGVTNGPLTALPNSTAGGNGVYSYGTGGFPTKTYNAANYWVDVLFKNS